jgi:hypothetical protein
MEIALLCVVMAQAVADFLPIVPEELLVINRTDEFYEDFDQIGADFIEIFFSAELVLAVSVRYERFGYQRYGKYLGDF